MTTVIVTTAIEPTSAQIEAIKEAVIKKHGKDIKLESVVDPDIIGGIQITIGSRQIDGSIKGKLEQIRKKFVSN